MRNVVCKAKFKTMTNRILTILILTFIALICRSQTDLMDNSLNYLPDISINNFSLHKPTGLFIDKDNFKQNLNQVSLPFSYLLILNKTQDQYFKLTYYPGGTYDQFSYFEIGQIKIDTLNKQIKYKISDEDNFTSETNIKIGISKNDFIRIKGNDFIKTKSDLDKLFYQLKIDSDTTGFLKNYNMPIYDAIYHFRSDTLIKFEFGFEYP